MRLLRFLHMRDWYVLLGTTILFFLLRFPSLFEPYWYGDEGIYEVIGKALRNGRILYTEIWDNKPPLLYALYALVNGNQFAIRSLSLLFGIGAVVTFYFLSKKLFTKASLPPTILFALLFATPYIEGNIANAENFMLFPILIAAFGIYSISSKESLSIGKIKLLKDPILFVSGVCLGLAFLTKIVALFDFAAFLTFLFFMQFLERKQCSFKTILTTSKYFLFAARFFLIGFLFPLSITIIIFLLLGALPAFLEASFFTNIGYVGYGNTFLIPQGYLFMKVGILCISVLLLFTQRNRFAPKEIFILLWMCFSLFSIFFSQRPYTHYVLMALPSITLLCGLVIDSKKEKRMVWYFLFLIILSGITISYFHLTKPLKVVMYYTNFVTYLTGKKDTTSYQSFFDSDTPRDYELASYLKMKVHKNNTIFLWGNSAQIYALSDTLPPGKFTVAYHINNNKEAVAETQKALIATNPQFIVLLPDYPSFPFSLHEYAYRVKIKDSVIYERRSQ